MSKCYFDTKQRFIHCEVERDCIGCDHEKVIAKSITTICQYCGKDIEARYAKRFCNNDCRLDWLRNRLSFDSPVYWGEPIFTFEEYREVWNTQRRAIAK